MGNIGCADHGPNSDNQASSNFFTMSYESPKYFSFMSSHYPIGGSHTPCLPRSHSRIQSVTEAGFAVDCV
jgi:hypothetical protein